MGLLFTITLSMHVILGVIGLMASFAVMLSLFKLGGSAKVRARFAKVAFISYLISWLSGGYYYVFYYGGVVKPIIKEGAYPWGHLVFMEFKEHAFLFLPVATLTLALAVSRVTEEKNPELLGAVRTLSVIVTLIALIVTLSGIIITGSAS